jgi:hypothetical protein
MSLKQRAHGSELHGYPIPRMPITFDLRQEPGAGKPHAGICAGAAGNSRAYRDLGAKCLVAMKQFPDHHEGDLIS